MLLRSLHSSPNSIHRRCFEANLSKPVRWGLRRALTGRSPVQAVMLMLAGVSEPANRDDALERERVLVVRAKAGDRQAMGQLLSQHGPALYRSVLLPRLGSPASAQEALSEVYARVVARIDRFAWQGGGLWPWLRTVALRVALDQLRARRRTLVWDAEDVARELDAADSATPVDQRLSEHRERQIARARVEAALATIHPRYARAIRLRVLEEQPREQVAQALGVTPSTLDVIVHRAMQALRKAISSKEPPHV